MRSRLPTLSLLVLLLGLSPAVARDGGPPGNTRRDLRELASQITGGASLLVDVASSRPVADFRERARHFEDSLGRRRDHVADDWRELRGAFGAARSSAARGRDPRITFLVSHLEEDLAEGDRLIGSYASEPAPPPSDGGAARLSFIDRDTCVGDTHGGNACPTFRESLTFPIPRNVAVISRLDGEWRDFGRGANAEIYVNDRLVWRTDVARDWDGDSTSLDVRIPPGSTLTVRSSNGDPIWIRRLTAETLHEVARDESYRSPWDFLWHDRH
jgi:hypothetical protein